MAVLFGGDQSQLPQRELRGSEKLRLLGSLALLTLAITAVLIVRETPSQAVAAALGSVSPRDIVASRSITYASEVLTERARQSAEAAEGIVYDASDPAVTRQQVSLARQLLDRITAVRDDADLPAADKVDALTTLTEVSLSPTSIERIIAFGDEEWLVVEDETTRVLGAAMRSVIRADDLTEARRGVPALVSLDLPDNQAGVVVDLVSDLVAANTFANEERTAEAHRRAREAVEPVTTSLEAGQVIVRAGDRVTELQMEALQQVGLMAPARDWRQDASALLSVAVVMMLLYLHLVINDPDVGRDWRRLSILGGLSLAFAGTARLLVLDHVLLPYVYPAAALPMLAAVLISPTTALVLTLLPAAFYLQLASGELLELASYAIVGSVCGVLLLSRMRHLKAFVWSGAGVLLANVAVLALFEGPKGGFDAAGVASLLAATVVNAGIAASISIIGYLLIGSLLGAVTSLQLLELSRPTQPLLRELLLKAPGTYNHSLMVANMAEQAVERIGANALLARVGSYYHDIGKVSRPYFYGENQNEGANVHDRLDPRSSAEIIIGHVKEGAELARRHRIPGAVSNFILEHHGRGCQDYFHCEAVKRYGAEAIEKESFRYPGPRPRSKETGVVMLADASEAAVRASHPETVQELARIVERVVDDRILEGELDECPLTLHDIAATKVAFVNVLQGMFHPRIQYPDGALIEQRNGSTNGADEPAPLPDEAAPTDAPAAAEGQPTIPGGNGGENHG
ncbi:MAG: HD family phosphohydrolase [Anaerolineae bacterium]